MLEFIVIGMVLDESLTGYDIKKHVENRIGLFYKAGYGSLYPMLKRLTEKRYLSMLEQAQGNRQKKFYQATEQGKAAFFEWLSSPINFEDGNNNHLAKVYFFDRLPNEIRNRQLQEYELRNANYLLKLQALEKQLNLMDDEDYYFRLSTLYYGICITQQNIKWCRHLLKHKPLSQLVEEYDETEYNQD